MTKLLVASGPELGRGDRVEIINLDEGNPNLICEDLPMLSVGVEHATGQLFMGKIPIICGAASTGR